MNDAPTATADHDEDAAMTVSQIVAAITGERMMTKRTGSGKDGPPPDEIARLAYHFYETRGKGEGHDVDDWLSAERQLTRDYR